MNAGNIGLTDVERLSRFRGSSSTGLQSPNMGLVRTTPNLMVSGQGDGGTRPQPQILGGRQNILHKFQPIRPSELSTAANNLIFNPPGFSMDSRR